MEKNVSDIQSGEKLLQRYTEAERSNAMNIAYLIVWSLISLLTLVMALEGATLVEKTGIPEIVWCTLLAIVPLIILIALAAYLKHCSCLFTYQGVEYRTPFFNRFLPYDDLRRGIQENGVIIVESGYVLKSGRMKIRFPFELGNDPEVREHIMECYHMVEDRTSMNLVEIRPSEISDLDGKYYHDRSWRTWSIVLIAAAVIELVVCMYVDYSFWLIMIIDTEVQYFSVWWISKAVAHSIVRKKRLQKAMEPLENVTLNLKKVDYYRTVLVILLAMLINFYGYCKVLPYI